MKLRHDPFQVFRGSQTPAGLYARQKWLGEADTPGWQTDFQEVVEKLFAGQMPDGSWQQTTMATISALFGLHLTVRSADDRIEDALNWLFHKMQRVLGEVDNRHGPEVEYTELKGLPFAPSRSEMLLTGATLFLCSIFNRQNDPAVLAVYKQLHEEEFIKEYLFRDIASLHNIFRALVVHPVYAHEALTTEAVDIYAGMQKENGEWGNHLPFYQTVNALAHLNSPEAEAQLERAFPRLLETQSRNGTWGCRDTEWKTFLCIHALKNKGLL
ncbi:MAG: hypothetical protein LJE94_14090 [Deltaproteobacteria bacterium]|nr:hypothetical protein [Deltaproteobacteria bacterium]